MSGEAPSSAMDVVHHAVAGALSGSRRSLIRDQIDPVFVGAIGAAYRARTFVERAELWADDDDHDHDHGPIYGHDEL